MDKDIIDRLQKATPPTEIAYLPQGLDKEQGTALALPYVDARFVQDRLDEACTPAGWQTEIKEVGGFVLVGIGIYDRELGGWVWKWDSGQDKPTEKEEYDATTDETTSGARSLISRGFKRAAVQWGIARDIYGLPKRRLHCKVYVNSKGKQVFGGWGNQPPPDTSGTAKAKAEAEKAGSAPTEPVAEPSLAVHANGDAEKAQTQYERFHEIAKTLKWDRDNINGVLKGCKDKETGRVNWDLAVEKAEAQVPK